MGKKIIFLIMVLFFVTFSYAEGLTWNIRGGQYLNGTGDHALLTNLAWSTANHTMDSDLRMENNKIILDSNAKSNLSYDTGNNWVSSTAAINIMAGALYLKSATALWDAGTGATRNLHVGFSSAYKYVYSDKPLIVDSEINVTQLDVEDEIRMGRANKSLVSVGYGPGGKNIANFLDGWTSGKFKTGITFEDQVYVSNISGDGSTTKRPMIDSNDLGQFMYLGGNEEGTSNFSQIYLRSDILGVSQDVSFLNINAFDNISADSYLMNTNKGLVIKSPNTDGYWPFRLEAPTGCDGCGILFNATYGALQMVTVFGIPVNSFDILGAFTELGTAVDHELIFSPLGTNKGILKWWEDEDNFQFQDDVNMTGNLGVDGNVTGNFYYADIHFHNDSATGYTTVIASQGAWTNISGFNQTANAEQFLNGFWFNDTLGFLVCNESGFYDISYDISFGNSGNNQEYQIAIGLNGIPLNRTDAHRKIGAAGDVGNAGETGFARLNKDDYITLMIRNNDGIANVQTHSAGINIRWLAN